jgi:crotonobetainyl-CoA:carnitine CoA-transferase CaiB-like acyl-CoA transferase
MLESVRVLDLTDEPGFLAGKILGDLGADVVKVEPPGGHRVRSSGPFSGGAPGSERSLLWAASNTSKRGIVLDLASDLGRADFFKLADVADVLLETARPGALDAVGVGAKVLRRRNPRLVYCAITPFGQTGPRAQFQGGDLVVVAMGGNAAMTGDPDRPPLRCTFPTSHYHACAEAALAVVMALWNRERTGQGDFVDVSMQECQLGTLLSAVGQYALHGRPPRRAGARIGRTREIWPAKDGFVSFGLRGGPARAANLAATVECMAECGMAPEWLRAMDWARYDPASLSDPELARLEEAFGAFFRTKTMRELYTEALRRRILLAPCNDARELLEHPQLRARSFFTELEIADESARLEHPAFFVRSSAPELRVRRRAPRLGEHQLEVAQEWLAGRPRGAAGCEDSSELGGEPKTRAGVFAGTKILELGAGAAGPVATRYFAEQGAEVIRVESRERPDFLRLLHSTPGMGLDGSPMFILLNPNKRSVALNLTHPEAIALVKRLVGWADAVVENFAPGVMERLGLDYEVLRAERPDLVMVSSSLFGQTGPQRKYPGFGGQGSAIAGFNHLTGWPDREAHGPWATITDSLAPRFTAAALASALLERRRTGRGQHLDVSQIEVGVYALCETIVQCSATGASPCRAGNHDGRAAPHAIYPCRGDDRWIAISVRDDDAWRALRAALGDPPWARESGLNTLAGRLARQEELDLRIASWTREREAESLMNELQAAGVEAGVVQDFRDLLGDPQLAHRQHFVRIAHPGLGELVFERAGFRLSESPGALSSPGPDLGADTTFILTGLLGLSGKEAAKLVADGIAT